MKTSATSTLPASVLVAVVPDRPSAAAAIVGGCAALAAYYLPLRLGLVTAALAGIAAGVAWNAVEAQRKARA